MVDRRDDSAPREPSVTPDDATRVREPSLRTATGWGGSAIRGAATKIGDVLAHTYQLEALLGRGGMGAVYRARHIALGTQHAIKVILPEYAHDPYFVALIEREARALHRVRHAAVVEYQGLFLDEEGRRYLVMEFVAGESLAMVLRDRALGVDEVRRLKRRLAAGLAAAHADGVFHRDLSPDNVILPGGDVDHAKIIDFGIAKSTDAASGPTLVGSEFAGKYSYVSPEQVGLAGGAVDARSDIYSLGLVLAAAALGRGRKLKMGDSPVSVVEARKSVPDLSEIPEALRAELRAMLQPRAQDRPQAMEALLVEAPPPRRSRRWVPILAGIAAGAVAIGGAAFFLVPRSATPPAEAPAASPPAQVQAGHAPSPPPSVEDLIAKLSTPPSKPEAAAEAPTASATAPSPAAVAPVPPESAPTAASQQTVPPATPPSVSPAPASQPQASPDSHQASQASAASPAAPPPGAASSAPEPKPETASAAPQPPAASTAPASAVTPASGPNSPPSAAPNPVPSAVPAEEKEREVASRQETVPATPKPPQLTKAEVAAALGDIECGAVSPAAGRDGIRLAGILPSAEASAAVLRKLGARFPGVTVANEARIVGRPFCAPLAALWRVGAVDAERAPRIALAKNRWRDGEAFTFDVVSTSPSVVFVDVSLVDAEGTVVHLLPTRKNPDASIAPGTAKRIGAERGSGGEVFEVSPPYGANLLLVVAAESPIFGKARPQVEKLGDYLPALEASLAKTRASVGWTMVETLPR